jgi:TonB family protein
MTPRLVLILGLAAAAGFAQPSAQESQTFGAGAVRPGDGITPPQVIRQIEPKYTSDAMNRKVMGDVTLEAVVQTDGTVGDVRVVKGLDAGLDAEAVKAAHQWLFKPGTDGSGKPVPVIVTLMLSFRMAQSPEGDFAKGACRMPSDVTIPPKLRHQVEPKYTHDALQAKIEGTVTVEIVVGTDGHVMRQRVTKSLDKVYGLDMEALKAVSQWTFEPDSGKCLGSPAPVLLTVELSFRVH